MPDVQALTDAIDPRVFAPDPADGDEADAGEGSGAPTNAALLSDTAQNDPPAPPSEDVTAEARGMGWMPKEKFRGDPRAWVSADEFVRRGREMLPIVNAALARSRSEADELRARLVALENASTDFQKFRDEQTTTARTAEETGLRAQRRKALEDADYDMVSDIDDKLMDIKIAARTAAATPKTPTVDPTTQRILLDFAEENPWVKDGKMAVALASEMRTLRAAGETSQGREFIDAAADRVRRLYPERFPSRRREPNMNDNDGVTPSSRAGGKKSYERLRPDFKTQCDKFVADKDLTREQFLASCGPEAFA